jgi:superfamily II DNA or RNA helicase
MMNISSDEDEDHSIVETEAPSLSMRASGKRQRIRNYPNPGSCSQSTDRNTVIAVTEQPPSSPISSEPAAQVVTQRPEFEDILAQLTGKCIWNCYHDTFGSFRGAIIDTESIVHPSNLYRFQIAALRRIQKAFLNTLTAEELKETMTSDKERKVIQNSLTRDCGKKNVHTETETAGVAQICRTTTRTPKNIRVRMPCGSGKTAICIWSAILFARSTLIVTDSFENALQTLKFILRCTNVARTFDVKFVCTDDGDVKKELASFSDALPAGVKITRTDRDLVNDEGNATRRHILDDGGTFGIVIMSSNLFKDRKKSGDAAIILRRTVFQSTFDLLVVDEADTTVANGVRSALEEGVLADSGVFDSEAQSSTRSRYTLRYKFGLFLSATWCRGVSDPRGAEYLLNIPQVVSMTAKEIADMGLIARSYINIVVCEDVEKWRREKSTSRNSYLKDLMPSHMRAIESIVNMHAYYGHKIMIYTHYISQFRTLERLFPNAWTISGEQDNRPEILGEMQTQTEYGKPFILLATNVCCTGLDIPDLNVVINAVNFGESDRSLTQRFGRASRLHAGKDKCYLYDIVAKGQHDWVSKMIDPEDPLGWSDVPRYSLLVADGYEESIRLWRDAELIECMKECLLAISENRDTATIHKAQLCYDQEEFQQIHVLGFLRSTLQDVNVFADCKSATASSSSKSSHGNATPKKRCKFGQLQKIMKQGSRSKATRTAIPLLADARKRPSSSQAPSSSSTVDVISDRRSMPNYFCANGFHLRAAQILELSTTSDPNQIWTHMLEVEARVVEQAKERERERSRTRATLVLHDNIQGLCPFPSP